MSSSSLHFMKFKVNEGVSINDLQQDISINNVESEDKFLVDETTDYSIDASYVYYYNTKERLYNFEKNIIEEVTYRKNTIVPFSIDLKNNILDIWSNGSNTSRLITKLGIALSHQVVIEPIEIDINKIILKLDNNKIKIVSAKIEEYPLEKNILADCIMNLQNNDNAIDIIKRYSSKLVKITVCIKNENDDVTVIIYKKGSVVVYKSKEDISAETLEIIRTLCVC